MTSKYRWLSTALTLVVAVAVLAIAMPHTEKFAYSYATGSRWMYEDLYADIDFPILRSEEQVQQEIKDMINGAVANSAVPYYRFKEDVSELSASALQELPLGDLVPVVSSCLGAIMQRGIVSDEGVRWSSGNPSAVMYIQRGKRADKCPASEVWTVSAARGRLLQDVLASGAPANADSLLQAAGVYELVVPNLEFDDKNTELINAERAEIASTNGSVSKGELLVRQDDFITAEMAQVLDSYRAELDNKGYLASPGRMWAGNILLSILMVALLYFVILFTRPSIFSDSRFFYIITVFLLTAVGTLVSLRAGGKFFLIVPYTLAALYLQAFFKMKVITPVYTVSLLPLLVFADNGVAWFLMFLLAGLVAAYVFQHLGKGWEQFLVALITFVVLAVALAACILVGLLSISAWKDVLVRLLVASMLAVAGYPLIYLFERIFSLVSGSRLRELCDTTNPLLRKLEQVAPGTFQHSLQVMNMADVAARSIGANPLLARTGALYHDIGKTSNPQCFVENESLLHKNEADKYHFGRTPLQSATDIIMHTTEGVELARKNHLPSIITDFILTHHGTSTVGFFYYKAQQEGGVVNEADFRYPGKLPTSKEQGILMICDSVEAASRSLKSYSTEAISEFVDKIVQDKLDKGQLNACSLTVRDLVEVRDTLKSYLAHMHHERIAYPDAKKTNDK